MVTFGNDLPTQEKYINPYTDFGFKKLFGTEIARYSDAERRQYEESRKEYWDYFSTMKTATDKAKQEGLEEGLEKGRAEGLMEGRAEGIVTVARSLKAMNLPVEQIMQATGLSAAEIEQL